MKLAAILLAACGFAAEIDTIQPQGFVSDFAGVLNPAHKAELERYAARLQAQTGAEIALVTIRSLEGRPIEDAANALYRRWGIGQKGKNEGALLLLATGDRRMRLEVGYGLEPILPDGYSGSLLRSMRPLLRERQYGPALLEAAHQVGQRIAQAKGVSLDTSIPSRRPPEPESGLPFLYLMVPLAFFAYLMYQAWRGNSRGHRRRYGSSGFPLPVILPGWGGNSRSHSGGGFGGYDSSDSFGGFGGGDSGGGGASSDW